MCNGFLSGLNELSGSVEEEAHSPKPLSQEVLDPVAFLKKQLEEAKLAKVMPYPVGSGESSLITRSLLIEVGRSGASRSMGIRHSTT